MTISACQVLNSRLGVVILSIIPLLDESLLIIGLG